MPIRGIYLAQYDGPQGKRWRTDIKVDNARLNERLKIPDTLPVEFPTFETYMHEHLRRMIDDYRTAQAALPIEDQDGNYPVSRRALSDVFLNDLRDELD